ncbi:MAG TPA: response regulator transcription factor, partial [Ktedonobacterales bacterium]|nr:response regulator transcription factor [Ktedonobacterales bacterium]
MNETAPATPDQPERIRVALADDQLLLRQSFQRLIELEDPTIEVVGAAADGLEAIALVERLAREGRAPQVMLMDVRMPRLDGLEATQRIRAAHPDVRVVILTTFDDEDYLVRGVQAGLNGYLLKDASAAELVAAIRAAYRGESPLQPSVA